MLSVGAVVKEAIKQSGLKVQRLSIDLYGSKEILGNKIQNRTDWVERDFEMLRVRLNKAKTWPFDIVAAAQSVGGEPEPDPQLASRTTQTYTKNLRPMPSRKVKIYGTVSAGDGNADQTFDADELQIPLDMQVPDLGALIVEGSSMEPFLEPKDIVIFRDSTEPRSGYVVAAAVREVEYVVKLCTHRDGKWVLKSLNPEYDDIETDYRICGFLVGIVRDNGNERTIRLNPWGLIPPEDLTRNLKA